MYLSCSMLLPHHICCELLHFKEHVVPLSIIVVPQSMILALPTSNTFNIFQPLLGKLNLCPAWPPSSSIQLHRNHGASTGFAAVDPYGTWLLPKLTTSIWRVESKILTNHCSHQYWIDHPTLVKVLQQQSWRFSTGNLGQQGLRWAAYWAKQIEKALRETWFLSSILRQMTKRYVFDLLSKEA